MYGCRCPNSACPGPLHDFVYYRGRHFLRPELNQLIMDSPEWADARRLYLNPHWVTLIRGAARLNLRLT